MRLAIDGRAIMPHPDGIGRYSKALIQGIAHEVAQRADLELIVYVTHHVFSFSPESRCRQVLVPRRYVHPYTILAFHRRLHNDGINLLFAPFFFAPVFFRGRTVLTVHDLMWSHYPRLQGPLSSNWNWLRWLTQRAAVTLSLGKASHVFCVSESTRKDLVSHYPQLECCSTVTHLGIDHLPSVSAALPVSERGNYLLFVGNTKPYKNLDNVISAFAVLHASGRYPELQLVIPGRIDSCRAGIERLIQELSLSQSVRLVGPVEDHELCELYRCARALVFPSRYEGFGIPVLEAMHFGTPVVTSDRSSLPEVAGKAALVANPDDPREIASACDKLLSNDILAGELAEMGRVRAASFRWESTVAESWRVLLSLLEKRL